MLCDKCKDLTKLWCATHFRETNSGFPCACFINDMNWLGRGYAPHTIILEVKNDRFE